MLRRSGPPLTLAALCAAALGLLGVLSFFSGRFHARDATALTGFLQLDTPRLHGVWDAIAHTVDPLPYALLGAALVGVALLRGRRRLALALPVVLLGSALTTQVIKQLAASDRVDDYLTAKYYVHIAHASFPSGHATAAMTLGLCATLVAPAVWRPVVAALGALFAIAVSFSILVLSWHFPSDILGGYLMATLWVGLAVAALAAAERRTPERVRPKALVPALVTAVLAGAVGLVVLASRPGALEDNQNFLLLALLVGAVPFALSGVLAALRGPRVSA